MVLSFPCLERHGCPCGHYTDPRRECRCSPRQIETYRRRISGPLLDRIDIHVDVPRVEYREMTSSRPAETSEAIRARVEEARRRQHAHNPSVS
jgi:predicted ATPase with chaperone activity